MLGEHGLHIIEGLLPPPKSYLHNLWVGLSAILHVNVHRSFYHTADMFLVHRTCHVKLRESCQAHSVTTYNPITSGVASIYVSALSEVMSLKGVERLEW